MELAFVWKVAWGVLTNSILVCNVLPSVVANNNGQKSLKELWNIFLSSTVDRCTSSAKLDYSSGRFSSFCFWQ
jgi:hypothetical protein